MLCLFWVALSSLPVEDLLVFFQDLAQIFQPLTLCLRYYVILYFLGKLAVCIIHCGTWA